MEKEINVIITTSHRGVWFVTVPYGTDLSGRSLSNLPYCRMAINWNTTRGLQELCVDGPNSGSRISPPSRIRVLHDVTAVFDVTKKAAEVWKQI